MSDIVQSDRPTYCAYHPNIETSLRCKRCDKPICVKCAISTPTGYICKDCERAQQKTFDTALSSDYIISFFLAGFISGIGSVISTFLGFFVILLAPFVGVIIAEATRAATHHRRSNQLFYTVSLSSALGAMPILFLSILSSNLWGILLHGFYLITVSTTAYQRLKGISIR
jgi:hypothetical protein